MKKAFLATLGVVLAVVLVFGLASILGLSLLVGAANSVADDGDDHPHEHGHDHPHAVEQSSSDFKVE